MKPTFASHSEAENPTKDFGIESGEQNKTKVKAQNTDKCYTKPLSTFAAVAALLGVLLQFDNVCHADLTRGPYLQSCNSTSIVVRWRTDTSVTGAVRFGTAATNLDGSVIEAGMTTEHEIQVTGLSPRTKYFYGLYANGSLLVSSTNHYFETAPQSAKPTRIWVIGDSGWGNANAAAVRDAYLTYGQGRPTDLWLMLGDNFYVDIQQAIFDMYPDLLRNTCLWPAFGNHDTPSVHDNVFTLPTGGQCGGVPSGSERYYSFNYANIHFVVLDSTSSDRTTNGTMLPWLQQDLAAANADWLIAFWHHPPYSKGSHNSDTETELIEMRENAVPILEYYGVDLVLAGHSHGYKRSYFINGHYGDSSTFNSSMKVQAGSGQTNNTGAYTKPLGRAGANKGTVHVVMGSSSSSYGFSGIHPAVYVRDGAFGSVVLDVNGNRLDATMRAYLNYDRDYFTIIKTGPVQPRLSLSRAGNELRLSWPTSVAPFQLQSVTRLSTSNSWNSATNTVIISNGQNVVRVPVTSSNQFFRLRSVP